MESRRYALLLSIVSFFLLAGLIPQSGARQYYAPPPQYLFPAPPHLAYIPANGVYCVVNSPVPVFFFVGRWWRVNNAQWFVSLGNFDGPWAYVKPRYLPPQLATLPANYLTLPLPGFRPIPYGELNRNWERWQRERYWEQHPRGWEGPEEREERRGHEGRKFDERRR
jgi:hypothetical protein